MLSTHELNFSDCNFLSSVCKPFHIFIFVSRTTGPISTKLGSKRSWVKGIQVYLNEGLCPVPIGNNNKIAKRHWRNFKITAWLISTNLAQSILG